MARSHAPLGIIESTPMLNAITCIMQGIHANLSCIRVGEVRFLVHCSPRNTDVSSYPFALRLLGASTLVLMQRSAQSHGFQLVP